MKDVENCENLVEKDVNVLMVTTRSATEKLNLKDIELCDDELFQTKNENCSKNELIDYMPNFKDISWSINELMNEQSNDPFLY